MKYFERSCLSFQYPFLNACIESTEMISVSNNFHYKSSFCFSCASRAITSIIFFYKLPLTHLTFFCQNTFNIIDFNITNTAINAINISYILLIFFNIFFKHQSITIHYYLSIIFPLDKMILRLLSIYL